MVILDATADLNPIYQRSKFYSIPPLEPVRSYRNAAQYVIRRLGTGIKAMDERGEEYAQETLDQVLAHYGDRASERRVLVVTNKNSEPKVRGVFAAGGFASLDVVHWGDIDGRNDFAHCDTCVTLTLHYGAPGQDRALKNALDGTTPSTEELNDDTDDVRELRELRVAGQLAQALGRTCIRDLTREDGD